MTPSEIEVLVARLTRIWTPHAQGQWKVIGPTFSFVATIKPTVRFICCGNPASRDYYLALVRKMENCKTGHLVCTEGGGCLLFSKSGTLEHQEAFKQFAGEWMSFFRCNCWLSGCPIEASAHEKTEWMQDFNCEELGAWDLKC